MVTKEVLTALELKEVNGESGRFICYAAAFGNTDSDGEVIDKGAFRKSIQAKNGKIPILYGHDRNQPIGHSTSLVEDEHGLKAEGQLILDVQRAREAYALLKSGALTGVSVGFRSPRDGTYLKDGLRHYKECDLFEFSLCVFPANPHAVVTSVKSASVLRGPSVEELGRLIDQAAVHHDEAIHAHKAALQAHESAQAVLKRAKAIVQTHYANDVNAPNPVGRKEADVDGLAAELDATLKSFRIQ